MLPDLSVLQSCFERESVLYSIHARREMRQEDLGEISEAEVREAVVSGEIIKEYPDDTPYPSVLILGFTRNRRPIHIVAAHEPEEDRAVVITAYEPIPELWYDLRKRKRE